MSASPAPRARGFIVTQPDPHSGVGSNLASLAGALWLAERSGRAVIVDWRNAGVLKDKTANYFSEFFETPEAIQGVSVYYAPRPELPDHTSMPETSGAAAIALAGNSATPETIVLRAYHGLDRLGAGSIADQASRLKYFYSFITPRPFVQQAIDTFAAEHFAGRFVVGVNVAEGNGMFAPGQPYATRVDTSIFARDGRFLKKVKSACDRVRRGVSGDAYANSRLFIATDSLAMRNLLLQVPGAVTRRSQFPPPHAGRFFCDYPTAEYTDRDAVVDQLADMFLLARCQALVHNYSVYNLYARVMTNGFGGRTCEFERLFARFWIRAAVKTVRARLRRLFND